MAVKSQSRYQAEAEKVYLAIFQRDIPLVVQARFLAVVDRLNGTASQAELDAYYHILQAAEDLEALELAARLTGRLPLLSRKFRAMVYLAETLPENQAQFVNEHSSFLKGITSITWSGLTSIFKAMRGVWLLRRFRHG